MILGAAIWSLVTLGAGGLALSSLYQRSVLSALDREIDSVFDSLLSGVQAGDGLPALANPPNDSRFSQAYSGRYFQVAVLRAGPDGTGLEIAARSRSLFDAELGAPPRILAQLRSGPGEILHYQAQGPDGQSLRVAAQSIVLGEKNTQVALFVAADRRDILQDVRRFALTLWAALGALGLGLLAAVWFQVRVGLAPLEEVRRDMAQVRRGKSARLEGEYPLEITPLTDELNALLDHNRAVVERARTHVGNLAHALKTPISVLLNESRAETGGLAELVRRQADGMARNVDHYLHRAQAAARAEAIGARCDAPPVLEDIVRTLERLYGRQKDLDIELEAEPGLTFRGERQDLEEMAGNVLENACKYGKSRVRIKAVSLPSRQRLEIQIEDDGPGLSEAQAIEALKRGKRLDETAPGQGLGLSIVDDLARLYGGELALARSELGGLLAFLRLPMAD